MSFSKFAALGALASLAAMVPQVSAHGYVQGIVVDGTYYTGFLVDTYNYETDPPAVIGWSETATDNGFVSDYTSADIICHKSAANAKASASIAAGKDITFEWTAWPSSHHGPVITYLADCGASCETVDKTTLEFVKFDASGLIDDTTVPGTWASDELIANNNSWTVTVPSSLKAGNYVLRHEIIALHSAGTSGGAQNYPQCINIEVTGSGTEDPSGTLGEALYTATDPGILINIYQTLASYTIPGPVIPAAFSGGSSSGSSSSASAVAASSSVATTSSVATSTPISSTVVATKSAALVISSSVPVSSETTAVTPTTAATTAPASSAIASSVSAAISSLETALPSSVLTSAAPTATATTTSGSTVSTAGLTVAELLDLLKQILLQLFASSTSTSSKARRHARDVTTA